MSLYEKMFAVMEESEAIEKGMTVGSGKNSYKAVSEAEILNMVKPLFKKHKLIIFPINVEMNEIVNVYNKTDYDGKTAQSQRAITQVKVVFRILDIESKEFQDVVGVGNGADSQDKGAGKAFTYSLKNALSKTFMLFSGEDTDNDHSDDIGKSAQAPQQAPQQVVQASQTGFISDKQASRLWMLSGKNNELVARIMLQYGYKGKAINIQTKDYNNICSDVEMLKDIPEETDVPDCLKG